MHKIGLRGWGTVALDLIQAVNEFMEFDEKNCSEKDSILGSIQAKAKGNYLQMNPSLSIIIFVEFAEFCENAS